MSRTVTINPVTRIEGHGKVHIELSDDGKVAGAYLHVLEFRGFERFIQGMQVELMPTITSRICGTCPHAHHLAAAKCLDKVFSAPPPRAAVLLRELLNCGSILHSHAIHFFALAGPDLVLDATVPKAKKNLVGLLESAPDLAKRALRLRSIGAKIAELVGGRGTHPVAAVAGGMAAPIRPEEREKLKALAAEALVLARSAMAEGKEALQKRSDVLSALPLSVGDMSTVQGDQFDLYDGMVRVQKADGTREREFAIDEYASQMTEEALPFSYGKQVVLKKSAPEDRIYRVGPLARINCSKSLDTPLANEELSQFKQNWGAPCHQLVLGHYARLIEMLHCAERAVRIVADDEIASGNVRTKPQGPPRSAVAHVEAPRGLLIHDYRVDANGIVESANFVVATQHNIASINSSLLLAAAGALGKSDDELIDRVEFAMRCFDPCLSCSTHKIGQMPLDITWASKGQVLRNVRR